MPLDPYVSCPCGSGKKFKWCCAPFYPQVEKAFGQERVNQHESALQTMRELTHSHGDQPAVWGYYAQFLYNTAGLQQTDEERGKMIEQAEEALSQALKLNPNFGMAHFLRGMFRLNEGELLGALILFRKAAESYDPEAHDQLAHVHELIFRNELMLNRPVAARAALERTVHFMPGDAELREQFEALFGDESRLPLCARKKYSFRPTAKPVNADAATGKLSDARKAFESLTELTPGDPAAWFNLGLVLAWLGEQPKAVEALNKSVELETDDHRAEEASALAEVMRCAQGMENDADYQEHGFIFPIRDPAPIMQWLQEQAQRGRLIGIQQDREAGAVSGMLVEELPSLLAVGGTTMARVVAKMTIAQGVVRLWHPDRASVASIADEFRTRVNLAVESPTEMATPINLGDVALEAIAYPTQTSDVSQAEEKLRDRARHFFEEVWAHRPLKSLAGNTPIDAVGSTLMRKRVFGAVQFIGDCFTGLVPHKKIGEQVVPMDVYDFANLRHKLGLEYISAPPPDVKVPVEAPAAPVQKAETPRAARREIGDMNAAELAGLDVAALSVDDLEKAMRSALKLDARDLAVAFAQAGLLKPHDPAKADRYPLYATAITGAAAEGDLPKAIQLATQGEQYDAEHNGSHRAVEFGLKRAQLHVRMKDVDGAAAAFDSLIAKHPDEGKFYTTAAEEMLRLKQSSKALYFAEKGLAKARSLGSRDLEGHCLELQDAAKRTAAV
jgi:tetratricopeptide (TPR) repeat protein